MGSKRNTTYASGQTIGSKASAPEKRQKTSDLEEQGTPEKRPAGVPQGKTKKIG